MSKIDDACEARETSSRSFCVLFQSFLPINTRIWLIVHQKKRGGCWSRSRQTSFHREVLVCWSLFEGASPIYSWPTNWRWRCTSKRLEVPTNYSTGHLLSISPHLLCRVNRVLCTPRLSEIVSCRLPHLTRSINLDHWPSGIRRRGSPELFSSLYAFDSRFGYDKTRTKKITHRPRMRCETSLTWFT